MNAVDVLGCPLFPSWYTADLIGTVFEQIILNFVKNCNARKEVFHVTPFEDKAGCFVELAISLEQYIGCDETRPYVI